MSAPALVRLDPAGFRRTPWKNGGGTTVDIADSYRPGAEPGGWNGMIWRFGRTQIAVPAPFSDLTGYDRVQAVIVGRGLVLRVSDGREIDLRTPFATVRYPGDWAIVSELEAGPVEVLNLMGARGEVELDLRFPRPGEALACGPGQHVAYAPAGAARFRLGGKTVDLAADHAVSFAVSGPVEIEGDAGIVALASIAFVGTG